MTLKRRAAIAPNNRYNARRREDCPSPICRRPIRYDRRVKNIDSAATPTAVAVLGYAGLIPFMGLALASSLEPVRGDLWHELLRSYGAVILSFVGALHWSVAMTSANLAERQRRGVFIWSVVPALLAWTALCLHSVAAYALLIAGFVLHFWRDLSLAAIAGLPAWYIPLRLRLSVVASISLAAGAISAY